MKEDMYFKWQQGDWDYKSDGIKQLKYELVGVTQINKNVQNDKRKIR